MIYYHLLTILGIIAGWLVSRALKMPKPAKSIQMDIWIAGGMGILLGAKLPVFLLNGVNASSVLSGKSLLGGLLGAFITINLYKYFSHQQAEAFGGRFAIPLAVAIGFGKIGCWLNGCCGGPFVIPIQLLESAFQFAIAVALYLFYVKTKRSELLFPLYLLSYLLMRFCTEFIRTGSVYAFGLTLYQLASLVFMPIVLFILYKRRTVHC